MKTLVMQTVHALLEQSGQNVPAKHLSGDPTSLQVYDVEHWPESFNSLLLHDFPSIVISIDSSDASLSGFVVTLRWRAATDVSTMASSVVHLVCAACLLCYMVRVCLSAYAQVSPHEMVDLANLYRAGANGTSSRGFAAFAPPPSPLTDELRRLMLHSEL
jgi:hypothetical protein